MSLFKFHIANRKIGKNLREIVSGSSSYMYMRRIEFSSTLMRICYQDTSSQQDHHKITRAQLLHSCT